MEKGDRDRGTDRATEMGRRVRDRGRKETQICVIKLQENFSA